jgi:hypothetical protein
VRIGLTRANACSLEDPRDPDLTEQTFLEMVRCRVYGIVAGYGWGAVSDEFSVCARETRLPPLSMATLSVSENGATAFDVPVEVKLILMGRSSSPTLP